MLIIFSGGEVLVRDDLERAGAEVTRRGYAWGMVTNGMALTEARLRSLLDAGCAAFRSVSTASNANTTISAAIPAVTTARWRPCA